MLLEELKELFFKEGMKKYNWPEEQLLEVKRRLENCTTEKIVILAARSDLLNIVEHFINNGGDLRLVTNDGEVEVNLLNIAAERDALNVINYLLDNKIFTVDQKVHEGSKTAFHSAVEENNISAAKLLLKRGANINAKYSLDDISYSTLQSLFIIVSDENRIEINNIEMARLLVSFGIQIPDDVYVLCDDSFIQRHPIKESIRNLLLHIKVLENLYFYPTDQHSCFTDAYKSLPHEVQEVWDVRVPRYHLNKLAGFIEKKFSKESTIEHTEYAALREYNSLSKDKKEVLKMLLARKNFNSDDLIKVDNYIKAHFFEIACIAKDLKDTAFKAIAEAGIIGEITQHLHFEDSGTKIAGSSSDSSADNIT